uniref:Sulfotransferase n=1 Tax=Brassica oleracea var. oleracea TaxID=109376 RepID=A0A0D3E3U2_BRAOL
MTRPSYNRVPKESETVPRPDLHVASRERLEAESSLDWLPKDRFHLAQISNIHNSPSISFQRSRFNDPTNPLLKRNPHELIPFIEIEFPLFPHVDVLQDKGNTLFATHMPHDFLPDSVVKSGCKMVYIWRDPKDTFVSFWNFMQKQRSTRGPLNSLEECFDMFCRGISGEGPYLDHVLGYWKAHQENPDKTLFLKYENVSADPLPYVKRLAEFMGYRFTAEEEKNGVVEKVVNLCSFETLKNLEVNKGDKERADISSPNVNRAFFKKGKTGDWVNYLTPDMAARMDGLMEEKFKGTGLLENGN